MGFLDEINDAIDAAPPAEEKDKAQGAAGSQTPPAADKKKATKYSAEFEEFAGTEET